MNCKICRSEKNNPFFDNAQDWEYGVPGIFNFFRCEYCGVIYLQPTPDEKELVSYYPETYHGYNSPKSWLTKFLIKKNLSARAVLYKKLIGPKGKILDVGCSDGDHFDILNEFGDWKFVGVEFNDYVATQGRQKGREIYTSTIEGHDFKDEKFDLIIMNHLIEHVVDPVETVIRACFLLRPGGYIVGETPNTNCWDFYLFGSLWGGMHTPRHTFLFNFNSIRKLFQDNGLELAELNCSPDTSHWSLSIQNWLQSKKIFNTKLIQGRSHYYHLLLWLLLPINILQKLLKQAGIMCFVAKKIK